MGQRGRKITLNGKNVARDRRLGLDVVPVFFTDFSLPLFLFLFPSAKPFSAALVSHGWGKSAREIRCPSPLVIFQLSVWLTSSLQNSSSRVYHLSSTFLLLPSSISRPPNSDLRPPTTIFVPCAYNFSSSQDRFSFSHLSIVSCNEHGDTDNLSIVRCFGRICSTRLPIDTRNNDLPSSTDSTCLDFSSWLD